MLNNLCESALTLAATRGDALLAPEVIEHVAVELFGLAPGGVPEAAAAPDADDPLAAAAEPDVPVLTDAIEAPNDASAPPPLQAAADLALLHDVRLEARRAARLREEQLAFETAAATLAEIADTEVDEFAATALLGAGRR